MVKYIVSVILALAAPSAMAGIPSRNLKDAVKPVSVIFLDFDGTTIVNNDFSEELLTLCQEESTTNCASEGELASMLDDMPMANITEVMGGEERLARVQDMLETLRSTDKEFFILSTSWEPVPGTEWAKYIHKFSDMAELGFDMDHILSLDDPGVGISADKGAFAAETLESMGFLPDDALFADDSAGNIESATNKTDTLYLPVRAGYDFTDMDYIEARASLLE
ncbi:hypothetical protein SARC_03241 [Sphaeroforma arctica JP610]|uniref:Haloacid dehalogenase-like hydrolase n=1 Tax=Sphaeroforma arctica JP610 TaxID=667725 RepID=A0A0L0G8H1_9EUKA|nr:hypothetical protein SARC_03241 [Sphaeroforma arctica JP610]KNC84538.1 hypothetical protein SARC_03241 [Sphaeroforma arctica JP610]|eukprot:XP_014158440.1 hypothetical protein SARC_03241 [Sphaeroforma arctica JP610]